MQKAYFLRISGREEGPYSDTQIGQIFADQRVDRNTPCRLEAARDWKTIDDYLPTLKYGTQLPPATPRAVQITTSPSTTVAAQRVAIVDLDIPFLSLVKIMFKWMAAGFVVFCCFIPLIVLIWLIVMAVFATLIGGAVSSLPHP
jgi:hypothetical protein